MNNDAASIYNKINDEISDLKKILGNKIRNYIILQHSPAGAGNIISINDIMSINIDKMDGETKYDEDARHILFFIQNMINKNYEVFDLYNLVGFCLSAKIDIESVQDHPAFIKIMEDFRLIS